MRVKIREALAKQEWMNYRHFPHLQRVLTVAMVLMVMMVIQRWLHGPGGLPLSPCQALPFALPWPLVRLSGMVLQGMPPKRAGP